MSGKENASNRKGYSIPFWMKQERSRSGISSARHPDTLTIWGCVDNTDKRRESANRKPAAGSEAVLVTQQTDDIKGFALPETNRDKVVGASDRKLQRVLARDTDLVRDVCDTTEEDVMENRLKHINKDESISRLC